MNLKIADFIVCKQDNENALKFYKITLQQPTFFPTHIDPNRNFNNVGHFIN